MNVMNINEKLLIAFGESSGQFLAALVFYNWSIKLLKYIGVKILRYVGIEYFAEIVESYKWAGQTVIESRYALNADRACFYRCSNGRFYLENNSTQNANIKVRAMINRTRDRGTLPLPDDLSAEYREWFRQLEREDEFIELFTPDLDYSDPTRNMLKKLGVVSYMAVKIRRENELYGILLFTWSDVKASPKNLLMKHREYLHSVKNTLLSETLFVINRTLKYKLRRFLRLET